MFWSSSSKERKSSSPPSANEPSANSTNDPSANSADEHSADEHSAGEHGAGEHSADDAVAKGAANALPRRQRRTPPESPSSKRGGELGSQPPAEDPETSA